MTVPIRERMKLRLMAEAYNLMNTVNVRYPNTRYGSADFCPADPGAPAAREPAGLPRRFAKLSLWNAERGIQPTPAPVGGTD